MSRYKEFEALFNEWHDGTAGLSIITINHPLAQKVINFDISEDLKISYTVMMLEKPRLCWNAAILLFHLVKKENRPPIPEYYSGRVPVIVECWIYWGLEEGYTKTEYDPENYYTVSCLTLKQD